LTDLDERSQETPPRAAHLNGHRSDAEIVAGSFPVVVGSPLWRKAQDNAARLLRWRDQRTRAVDLEGELRRTHEHIAMISHELRNSVGAIRFATRLIEATDDQPELVARAGATIDRQAAQMVRIIDDLLDVSLVRSGRLSLRRERIDLRVVAEQAVAGMEAEMNLRGQRLTLALPEAPVWLQADPGRLAQVLVNLLRNAAKFTDSGGELHLSIAHEAGHATVRVSDSGIGIAPEVLKHVFEPFMQAESSRLRSEAGVGIGLALVSSLVEMHGGSVSAASAGLGKGSEFTVDLPVQPS
jgi:signal transduction histidine kinase